MKIHENCTGEKCGTFELCKNATSLRYGCVDHNPDIELCITCKHIEKYEEDGEINYNCILLLDYTTPDDYCGMWEYKGE